MGKCTQGGMIVPGEEAMKSAVESVKRKNADITDITVEMNDRNVDMDLDNFEGRTCWVIVFGANETLTDGSAEEHEYKVKTDALTGEVLEIHEI